MLMISWIQRKKKDTKQNVNKASWGKKAGKF